MAMQCVYPDPRSIQTKTIHLNDSVTTAVDGYILFDLRDCTDSVFGEDQDRTCTTLDVSEPNRLAMFNQSDCGTGIETDYVGIGGYVIPAGVSVC
ncbi:Uncharacterized protein APZ42_022399 [Daphnia magna]|uniref:Uncharacterized protein n=1 Tax=Daphnia magna TaxID=35525 RepID=A0A164VG60_9CRUS|nr:Uncharacterized protein APZ42_022399 [Daphnia magna]